MIKTSLAFLTGVLSMAVILYMAGARFALPIFFAGVCVVIVPGVAVLSSVERIRSVAKFLNAFADGLASSPLRSRPPVVPFDQERKERLSQLVSDISSALENQGVGSKLARQIADDVVNVRGIIAFDPAIRAALTLVPRSTRRAS